jgi:hypothetical protein
MTAPDRPAATSETYSWAGTDAKGIAHIGRTGYTATQIAVITENYYRKGWRSLRVARGWDLPDAGTADLVAAIGPHPGTGRRTWWAEGAGDAERAVRAQLGETDGH